MVPGFVTLIIFLFALGGMIFVHELGHFIAARWAGIEVEEFGLGLPSYKIATLFKWQGTEFTIHALLLGGFIRPKGENDPNVPGGLASANPWKRLVVLFAGPLMNLITAVVVFSFLIGLTIDVFSNTPGMHAFACTLAGFIRHSLIQLLMGKDLPEGINPSYKTFGYGGFFRYTLLFVVTHHVALCLIESLTLFDPLFLAIRIAASVVTTTLLICTIEAFNIGSQKSGD